MRDRTELPVFIGSVYHDAAYAYSWQIRAWDAGGGQLLDEGGRACKNIAEALRQMGSGFNEPVALELNYRGFNVGTYPAAQLVNNSENIATTVVAMCAQLMVPDAALG
jgi:hypothetical protein